MKKFTKKWNDYINKEWKNYLVVDKINVIYPDELYKGNYTDELLEEEFENYYNAKKKYVSMYDYFDKEFGYYEKIELLSREEEYKKYVDRFNSLIEISINRFKERVSSCKNTELECININDIDFKLLILGKINTQTRDTYRKTLSSYDKIMELGEEKFKNERIVYFKSINKFLTTYDEYYDKFDDVTDIKELRKYDFHDTKIVSFDINNNDIVIDIDFCCADNTSLKITFKEASVSEDISKYFELKNAWVEIYSFSARYYDDIGCYFYLNLIIWDYDSDGPAVHKEIEIVSKDVVALEHITSEFIEQYNWKGDLYQSNLDTVKDKLSDDLLAVFHIKTEKNWLCNTIFNNVTPFSYDYTKKNLSINYVSAFDDGVVKCSLEFIDVCSISIIRDGVEISKKEFYLYFEELAGNIYNETNGEVNPSGKSLLNELLKFNTKLKIKDVDGLFEVGMLIIKNIEIIIICNDIKFVDLRNKDI